jgi:OHCU decarboxylase
VVGGLRRNVTLETLNALDIAAAERELLRCCGSVRWAQQMAARRPFPDRPSLELEADTIWSGLDRGDWLEAFAAHPRIGDGAGQAGGAGGAGEAGRAGGAGAEDEPAEWSSREQAGMAAAGAAVRQRLAEVNREYERRFGFIFIVCATGKNAGELLAIAEERLRRPADEELFTAAGEQRKITRIRLARLLTQERFAGVDPETVQSDSASDFRLR